MMDLGKMIEILFLCILVPFPLTLMANEWFCLFTITISSHSPDIIFHEDIVFIT